MNPDAPFILVPLRGKNYSRKYFIVSDKHFFWKYGEVFMCTFDSWICLKDKNSVNSRPPPILRKSVSATVKAEPSGPIKIFSVAATSGWISFVIGPWICADTSLALSSLSQVYHLWHRQDWHQWGLTPLATGDQPAQSRRLGSNSIWLLSFSLTLRLTSLVQSLMGPSENYFFVWIFMMPDALVRLE